MNCRCGHPREAHKHHRRGTDCSRCTTCDMYRWAKSRRLAVMLAAAASAALAVSAVSAKHGDEGITLVRQCGPCTT
jgi:hypothetical protein